MSCYLGGDVIYHNLVQFSTGIIPPREEPISLVRAKEIMLGDSPNKRITRVQVYGCFHTRGLMSTLSKYGKYNKPDFHLLSLLTDDGRWWVFNSDFKDGPGKLFVGQFNHPFPDDPVLSYGQIFGARSTLMRNDESTTSVDSLFRFLDQKYIVDIQFEGSPGDTFLFCKEMFDKLAKTKSFWPLHGALQSQGFASTGEEWKGLVRFIDLIGSTGRQDFGRDLLGVLQTELDPSRTNHITHVYAYKVPLSEAFYTNMLLFHSYVTFKTIDSASLQEVWWSLEKNSSFIILQNGYSHEEVRDKVGGEVRCKSWFYWRPQLIAEDVCKADGRSVRTLLQLLEDNDELGQQYHGVVDNCQVFSKVVFDWLAAGQTLYFGLLAESVTPLHRWMSGRRDYRPRTD